MNNFFNLLKVLKLSESAWATAKRFGLTEVPVKYEKSPFISHQGRQLVNMSSCSYLGLDTHPDILKGAADFVYRAGSLHLTSPRTRVVTTLLAELEEKLTEHFNNHAIAYISCSAATSAFLPIYASGALTNGKKPLMIFDRNAHFSINHIKPICADETKVFTCNNNDLNYIEDTCKKNSNVAYIADGTYSVEGHTPLKELTELQERYGLFLYFDDSHSFSVRGKRGRGYILENINHLGENTVIVGSLAKGFGACGGVLLFGEKKCRDTIIRLGNYWSQYLNSAGIGGISASIDIHNTEELSDRQKKWKENLDYLDREFITLNRNTLSPVRVIPLKTPEIAVELAKNMFDKGFLTSAVSFPTVRQGMSGLRVMPRADMDTNLLNKFCAVVKEICGDQIAKPFAAAM